LVGFSEFAPGFFLKKTRGKFSKIFSWMGPGSDVQNPGGTVPRNRSIRLFALPVL